MEFSSSAAAMRFQQWKKGQEGAKCVDPAGEHRPQPIAARHVSAWLANVAQHTGKDEEELHEFLLDKCAPRVVVKINGKRSAMEIERAKRTSGGYSRSMSKTEMSEYMEKAAVLTGYSMPTPAELLAMGYLPS